MTELSAGDPRFRNDRGGPDPAVTAALAAFAAGTCGEHEVLVALADTRLLVPVVAVSRDTAGAGDSAVSALTASGEKDSEMATPSIVGRDGRRALPAFTSLATLQRWQPDARPVPVPAASVWQAAAAQSEAVIIDIAGPVPLPVEGSRLAALATGARLPLLHEDPDVRAAVAAAAAAQPPGVRVRLGPPQPDADLTLELAPADQDQAEPVPASVLDAIVTDVAVRLGGRIPRGIAVQVRPPVAGRAD